MARFYVLEIHELLTGKTHLVRWKVLLQNDHALMEITKLLCKKPGGSSFVISEFTFEGEFEFTNVQYGGSSQPVYNQYIMDSGTNSTVLRWQRWIYE